MGTRIVDVILKSFEVSFRKYIVYHYCPGKGRTSPFYFTFKEFWATTNVGGLTNAGTAQRPLRKIIWLILVGVGTFM